MEKSRHNRTALGYRRTVFVPIPERRTRRMSGHTFRLYNTLTHDTEPIQPIEDEHLRFYSCGPTVYMYAHIGNFRSFLTGDLIRRTAEAIGWDVTNVTNITDVGHLTEDDLVDPGGEDRMQQALEREGSRFANIYDLARHYTEAFLDDWQALNLREPEVRPRATEHVTDQLHAVIALVEKGHAYTTDQGVYFSVESFEDYGALSGNTEAQQLQAAERDTVEDPNKKDPRDFALWKIDPEHLMHWHSPWGWGFPGWHIECSVMGMTYLGDRFDLHTGGEDLIFPHHECEIAQNQAIAGHQVINYWVHTRFLQVEGEKMSKSKGNFYTVRDLISPHPDDEHVPASIRQQGGIDPLALRYALLQGQYRKPFNFTLDTLETAARHIRRFRTSNERVTEVLEKTEADPNGADASGFGDALADIYDDMLEAMCNDLNSPAATSAALAGLKVIEDELDALSPPMATHARDWLDRTNDLLGIVEPEHATEAPDDRSAGSASQEQFSESVDQLLEEREAARSGGEYARADAIRDTLEALGIEVMDTPEGTEWRRKVEL